MRQRGFRWARAALIFVLTFLLAGLLLPLARVQPKALHEYLNGLSDWLRISAAFAASVLFTLVLFKLLSPRLGHLAYWTSHPPAWLAALAAWCAVAAVDLCGGFGGSYRASPWEWLGYGGGSLLLVALYSGLLSESRHHTPEPPHSETVTLERIESVPWSEIEAWLRSDAPSRYDFLDNRNVACRVSRMISQGTRSVGVVGPFGAGKTTLVEWIADQLKGRIDRRYFICRHSCWGFETSASAIHDMLGSALTALGNEIDTFQVDSLPDSYRRTFSAGGEWIETITNLVLRHPDPMDQFDRLSDLLDDLNGKIVFVIEDLDRNDTRSFEIQEVLAFLERLKGVRTLAFVLTGGLSSSQRIDYAKLCDHIEYLRTVQPEHSSALIDRLRHRCLDTSRFPHVRLAAQSRNYEWNALTGMMMREFEEFPLPQAVAVLLNTPRSLRHAIGRTYSAWQTLHGEIAFDHLLAVNVLRFGAPESLQFLIRRWDRLRASPQQFTGMGDEHNKIIRQAVVDDWTRTIRDVEWNPAAALRVMEFILPATEYWIVNESRIGHSTDAPQGVAQERYWTRAINEGIDDNDIRDQEVILDTRAWLESPDVNADMIAKITSQPRYATVWKTSPCPCSRRGRLGCSRWVNTSFVASCVNIARERHTNPKGLFQRGGLLLRELLT